MSAEKGDTDAQCGWGERFIQTSFVDCHN